MDRKEGEITNVVKIQRILTIKCSQLLRRRFTLDVKLIINQ